MPDRSRALLVGINDYADPSVPPLLGCRADVAEIAALLQQHFAFRPADIRSLIDRQATRDAILSEWAGLAAESRPGDRVFFGFAGHGTYTADLSGDEPDGTDEALVPHDGDPGDIPRTCILDDQIGAWVASVPRGVGLAAWLDCCHSGTGAREIVSPDRRNRFVPPSDHDDERLANVLPRRPGQAASNRPRTLILSACNEIETAAEVRVGGMFRGAGTLAFCEAMRSDPGAGRKAILTGIRGNLKRMGVWQSPSWDGSRVGDMFGQMPRKKAVAAIGSVTS